jgi:hypothetical protein
MTIEVCFVFDDAAELSVLDKFGEGDEVGVPAAVYRNSLAVSPRRTIDWALTLVNSKELVLLLRNLY